MRRSRIVLATGLAVAAALLLGRARASSVTTAEDLPELVRLADQIAEVEVLAAHPAWLPDGRIETRYTFSILTPMKGWMASVEEVRFPGGAIAGMGLHLPGMPSLQVGDRAILFLSAPSPGQAWRLPVGLAAGAYRVVGSAGARRVVPAGARGREASVIHDHDAFIAHILEEVARERR